MNRPRSLAAVGLSIALGLAACGGDADLAESQPTATEPTGSAPGDSATTTESSSGTGDVVDPTIDPDVPEVFLPGVGPVAVIGESLPVLPDGDDDPAIGMSAPVLVAENFDGGQVRVDPAADGRTWLIFLAHWCPHCNDEIPVINTLRDEGRIPEGIDVIGVSTAVSP
ncbi:MAG: redoxin domain-containing protein, partial [Ilumatobacteraceae bacterium]